MGQTDNCLFSLELVVEKLYIPHTPCRFPAAAFRLLDFPTIVIKHVEDDLGKAIRQKISFDPYYQLPQQFIELKDKHGNFMIKKGKSCLFTMPPDVLKQHLASTPLYVMVIDLFPETPKLVGNSTVPLDSLMELICSDIAKLGLTVPSVHGDKGLFKLYNLMGKEIGYFVLGFRLLCLGPGMIPHLPDSMLLRRRSHGKQKKEERKVDEMIKKSGREEREDDVSDESSVIELRNSACMTDPIKHDVLLQTVELEDKAIHVEFSNKDVAIDATQTQQTQPVIMPRATQSTQTGRRKAKALKEIENTNYKWVEQEDLRVEDDGPIINNIICPPPLFYNSEATPAVAIERNVPPVDDQSWELSSVGDLSDIESFSGHGLEKKARVKSSHHHERKEDSPKRQNILLHAPKPHIPQARQNETVQGLNVAPQADAVFPLLTALIQELSCIQNPEFLLGVSQKIQVAQSKKSAQYVSQQQQAKIEQISPSAVSAVAAALTKKLDASKDQIHTKDSPKKDNQEEKNVNRSRLSSARSLQKEAASKPKQKKLVYGMTNTQRLRLQKSNPSWLRNVEKEAANAAATAAAAKPAKQSRRVEREDLNLTNFSDTLTEVRRLAEIEMNSTAGGDTIRQVASEVMEEREPKFQTIDKMKTYSKSDISRSKMTIPSPVRASRRSPPRASRNSPSAAVVRKDFQTSKSHSQGSLPKSSVPKPRSRMRHRRAAQKELMNSSDSDELMRIRKRPVPSVRRTLSHSLDEDDQKGNYEVEDVLSARSDLPSSRSRSIEVRLPSADPGVDDNATITDDEYDDRERGMAGEDVDDDNDDDEYRNREYAEDDDIPLPDDSVSEKPKVQVLNFPRYVSREMSLPDSIEGVPNGSLNASGLMDENSPLESTRQSRNMTEDQNESRILHSTDYDTRQFHSTDEPELQGLISEEEEEAARDKYSSDYVESGRQSVASVRTSQKFPVINPQMSENSPVPSVRRSTTKLDTGGQSYLPSMSLSKGYTSPVSSRPSTPKGGNSSKKTKEFEPLIPNREGRRVRGSLTPRSASTSPRRPTPRSRRAALDFKNPSIHTDSLSSYVPSDPENVLVSLSSNSGNYSDDFVPMGSGESVDGASSVEQLPKLLPASKLGYTIS